MSVKEIIDALCAIALRQPAVGTVVENNVYRLKGIPDVKYGVFAYVQGRHTVDLLANQATVRLTLFYVDRVDTADRSETFVQSTGVDVLTNIVRTFLNKYEQDLGGDLTIQPFKELFTDDCAGDFAEVEIITDAYEGCEDEFDN